MDKFKIKNGKINCCILFRNIVIVLFIIIFLNPDVVCCTAAIVQDVVSAGNDIIKDDAGIVYRIDNNSGTCGIVSYEGNGSDIIIPDIYNGYSVVSIADNVFRENDTARSLVIGSNIETIGSRAFAYCNRIEDVTFKGNKLKVVSSECFVACESLKRITIPSSVQKIGDGAFAFCSALYQVVISENVRKFGINVFYNCGKDKLTIVTPNGSKAGKFAVKNNFLVTDTTKTRLLVKNIRDIEGHKERILVYNAPSAVKWKSLNRKVAKVDNNGKVTALKAGTTKVMASTGGKTLECKVRVFKRNKKNCLKVIYSKYVKREMTDYEKIYAAHAWLIKNVKYDKTLYKTGTVPYISHTAKGTFNKGVAVCDGYAKAFIIIMQHYRIPCIMVTGGQHAWNMVKIKNKWYHIDCTYDDPVVNGSFNNKHVFMDFFLKTDQEMYATHIWNYSAFPKCNSTKVNKNYRTQAGR
jgi:hypothetical protein